MENNKKTIEDINNDTFYKIEELSLLMKVSKRTLRRYCEEKIFEHSVKLGRKDWVVPGCDVRKLCGYGDKEQLEKDRYEKESDANVEDEYKQLENEYDDDLSW